MARILLVEDDDHLRTMLKSILTNSGYEVWDAPNGTRACHLHDQQSFDLVITDLVMPEKDGLEVIIELRRTNQDVRIIAMSGTGPGSGELYLRVAQRLGADLTLSKPFAHRDFLEAVCLALET